MRLFQPDGSGLPDAYELVACSPCDLVFADTPATQQEYDDYYSTKAKYSGPLATGSGVASADRRRLMEVAARIAALVPDRDSRILDLGCGGGGLLEALRQAGYRHLMGIDPDPLAIRRVEYLGFGGQVASLSQLSAESMPQSLDLVVLSHVAEHLRDLSLLAKVQSMLAPAGLLYLEVPDPLGYVEYPRSPFYYFDSEHINHFGPISLGRLSRWIGRPVQTVSRFPLPLPDGGAYPACAVVYGDSTCPVAIGEFASAIAAVKSYLNWSVASGRTPIGPPNGQMLIWGAGSITQRLLGSGQLDIERVGAFLDADPKKIGGSIAGRPILDPPVGLVRFPNLPLLVCAAIASEEILEQRREADPVAERPIWRLTTDNRGEQVQ